MKTNIFRAVVSADATPEMAEVYFDGHKCELLEGLDNPSLRHVVENAQAIEVGDTVVKEGEKRIGRVVIDRHSYSSQAVGQDIRSFLTGCGLNEQEASDVAQAASDYVAKNPPTTLPRQYPFHIAGSLARISSQNVGTSLYRLATDKRSPRWSRFCQLRLTP